MAVILDGGLADDSQALEAILSLLIRLTEHNLLCGTMWNSQKYVFANTYVWRKHLRVTSTICYMAWLNLTYLE